MAYNRFKGGGSSQNQELDSVKSLIQSAAGAYRSDEAPVKDVAPIPTEDFRYTKNSFRPYKRIINSGYVGARPSGSDGGTSIIPTSNGYSRGGGYVSRYNGSRGGFRGASRGGGYNNGVSHIYNSNDNASSARVIPDFSDLEEKMNRLNKNFTSGSSNSVAPSQPGIAANSADGQQSAVNLASFNWTSQSTPEEEKLLLGGTKGKIKYHSGSETSINHENEHSKLDDAEVSNGLSQLKIDDNKASSYTTKPAYVENLIGIYGDKEHERNMAVDTGKEELYDDLPRRKLAGNDQPANPRSNERRQANYDPDRESAKAKPNPQEYDDKFSGKLKSKIEVEYRGRFADEVKDNSKQNEEVSRRLDYEKVGGTRRPLDLEEPEEETVKIPPHRYEKESKVVRSSIFKEVIVPIRKRESRSRSRGGGRMCCEEEYDEEEMAIQPRPRREPESRSRGGRKYYDEEDDQEEIPIQHRSKYESESRSRGGLKYYDEKDDQEEIPIQHRSRRESESRSRGGRKYYDEKDDQEEIPIQHRLKYESESRSRGGLKYFDEKVDQEEMAIQHRSRRGPESRSRGGRKYYDEEDEDEDLLRRLKPRASRYDDSEEENFARRRNFTNLRRMDNEKYRNVTTRNARLTRRYSEDYDKPSISRSRGNFEDDQLSDDEPPSRARNVDEEYSHQRRRVENYEDSDEESAWARSRIHGRQKEAPIRRSAYDSGDEYVDYPRFRKTASKPKSKQRYDSDEGLPPLRRSTREAKPVRKPIADESDDDEQLPPRRPSVAKLCQRGGSGDSDYKQSKLPDSPLIPKSRSAGQLPKAKETSHLLSVPAGRDPIPAPGDPNVYYYGNRLLNGRGLNPIRQETTGGGEHYRRGEEDMDNSTSKPKREYRNAPSSRDYGGDEDGSPRGTTENKLEDSPPVHRLDVKLTSANDVISYRYQPSSLFDSEDEMITISKANKGDVESAAVYVLSEDDDSPRTTKRIPMEKLIAIESSIDEDKEPAYCINRDSSVRLATNLIDVDTSLECKKEIYTRRLSVVKSEPKVEMVSVEPAAVVEVLAAPSRRVRSLMAFEHFEDSEDEGLERDFLASSSQARLSYDYSPGEEKEKLVKELVEVPYKISTDESDSDITRLKYPPISLSLKNHTSYPFPPHIEMRKVDEDDEIVNCVAQRTKKAKPSQALPIYDEIETIPPTSSLLPPKPRESLCSPLMVSRRLHRRDSDEEEEEEEEEEEAKRKDEEKDKGPHFSTRAYRRPLTKRYELENDLGSPISVDPFTSPGDSASGGTTANSDKEKEFHKTKNNINTYSDFEEAEVKPFPDLEIEPHAMRNLPRPELTISHYFFDKDLLDMHDHKTIDFLKTTVPGFVVVIIFPDHRSANQFHLTLKASGFISILTADHAENGNSQTIDNYRAKHGKLCPMVTTTAYIQKQPDGFKFPEFIISFDLRMREVEAISKDMMNRYREDLKLASRTSKAPPPSSLHYYHVWQLNKEHLFSYLKQAYEDVIINTE